MSVISKAISDRHDIVHRNGKSLAGVMGKWDTTHIADLINAVTALAKSIQAQMERQRYLKIQAEVEIEEV